MPSECFDYFDMFLLLFRNDMNLIPIVSEGSICTLYDGSKGICKNIGQCESIKEGIKHRTLKLEQIVGCSFVVIFFRATIILLMLN